MYALFKKKHQDLTSVMMYPGALSESNRVMNMWLLEHNEKPGSSTTFVQLTDESLVAFKLKFGK
jgi:hypothetical protein